MIPTSAITRTKGDVRSALKTLKSHPESGHNLAWIEAVSHLSRTLDWLEDLRYIVKYPEEEAA